MRAKSAVRVLAALAMAGVGLAHFIDPEPFVRIVPAVLPAPLFLVYLSGAFEILGGVGLLVPRTRTLAAWGLVALFLAVFPANLNMAINHLQLDPAHPVPQWACWARLPFQALFIALAFWLRR